MDAQSWAVIIGAVFIGLTGLLNVYLAWKSKQASEGNSDQIADNTAITKAGAAVVVQTSKIAAMVADKTLVAAESLAGQLNGQLNARMVKAIKNETDPLREIVMQHGAQIEKNTNVIKSALSTLAKGE